MIFKDSFTTLDNWNYDEGVYIDDDLVKGADGKWLWKELPTIIASCSVWRMYARFYLKENAGIQIGLADNNPSLYTNRIAGGCHGGTNRPTLAAYGPKNIFGSVLSPGYYNFSLVCNGDTVTACMSDDENKTLAWTSEYKPIGEINLSHIYIRFFAEGVGIERIAISDGFNSFDDEDFDVPLKFVVHTDVDMLTAGSSGNKGYRAFIETPVNPDIKHKLVFLSPGFSGNWERYIYSDSNFYTHVMSLRGYTSVSQDIFGDENGHWIGTTRAWKIRQKLYSLFDVHYKCFTVGISMGALFACNMAIDYPEIVSRIVLIAGHSNLMWRYYSIWSDTTTVSAEARKQSFWSRYGATEATIFHKTRGRNPHENYDRLANFPLIARHSANETQVEAINSTALVDGINNAGGNAVYIPSDSASHSYVGNFNPEGDADFFDLSTDVDLAQPPHITHFLSGGVRVS